MTTYRPLSAWVARLADDSGRLGPINDGDDRADARSLSFFAQGWSRLAVPWNGHTVLGLRRNSDALTVVELDDYGTPIAVGPQAASVIERIEAGWPSVAGEDVLRLGSESLALRYWLLERLDAEGEPPDSAFAILPWDLLDRAADAVSAAFETPGEIGELVEMRHWLTPAVRGLTGPLEQLDYGLRDSQSEVAGSAATGLLANLRDLPLSRIPETSRRRIAVLVEHLQSAYPEHRTLARTVIERLTGDSGTADHLELGLFEVLLVPTAYLGPERPQSLPNAATLEITNDLRRLFGAKAQGTVLWTGTELSVKIGGLLPDTPAVMVRADSPDALLAPLERRGAVLSARIPWREPELPERLVFRVAPE